MFDFVDRELVCRECSQPFIFTAGEQQFFQAKGLQNDPGRCPECRSAYKARIATPVVERPVREKHAAVCAECGNQAMIPFLPRNDRPVYCSSCFDKVRAGALAGSRS